MKFDTLTSQVPFKERAEINHRIVNLILAGKTQELSPEVVYNQFTGKGALHGLDFNRYNSYYEFSEAKKDFEQGQFFTPDHICERIIQSLRPPTTFIIADITCGKGSFFNHLPDEGHIYGNELDNDAFEVCKYLFPNAHLQNTDFLYYDPGVKMDMIIGNPPFNLKTEEGTSQFAFVKKSYQLLKYDGLLAFIAPLSFLADDFQDSHKISWINDHFSFVFQSQLPKGSFDAVIETKVMAFQKKGSARSHITFSPTAWVDFDEDKIYEQIIAPIYEAYHKNRYKNKCLLGSEKEQIRDINYLIKRRLWHIKENRILMPKYYKRSLSKIRQMEVQKQPLDMSDKKWDQIKLTPAKILAYLETAIRGQNSPPFKKIVKLVKTQYGLKLKAYHPRLRKQEKFYSVHELLVGNLQIDYGIYAKLYRRKKKALSLQNTFFTELSRSPIVDRFLDEVVLEPKIVPGVLFQDETVKPIWPNAMQKNDLGLILQKKYDLLAWEQGGGKTVAGMLWMRYHQSKVTNFFVVGPAIAINTTWTDKLDQYCFHFVQLENIRDVSRIKPGLITLVSYDQLIKLQRHIKKFVKISGYKIGLIVDESDELTNPYSLRSLAALDCFRKVRLKLETTGTTTRNTINEIYTQMELLYNNSTAFMCWATNSYHIDKTGELQQEGNEYYGRPFPPHYGSAVFRSCFCPVKSTVFGIQKENQDVYNAQVLREIINKTIITRKFEEIVGEKKYTIHVKELKQAKAEKALYSLLMKEFLSVCYDYYTSTGNSRKEAGLRLVRQMMVLIKATSIPHTMKHYVGGEEPEKFKTIAAMIGKWPNDIVTVGTTLKKTNQCYVSYLAKQFPNRKIYVIDGEMLVATRKKILAQLKASKNGILISTQQALKSSVNIPFCHKVIIESLQWNIPKIAQFYFRFIRFDSLKHADVYFVNYMDTIEVNLLALLMEKERLNDFIKTTNEASSSKIYEQFGIDIGILDLLIQKNYDADGKLTLSWGRQRMVA